MNMGRKQGRHHLNGDAESTTFEGFFYDAKPTTSCIQLQVSCAGRFQLDVYYVCITHRAFRF